MFWPIKNSGEVLRKLKDIGYQATSLSTYDFSTLYTTLPHNLVKEKLLECCLTDQGSLSVMQHIVSVESSSLLLHSYLT